MRNAAIRTKAARAGIRLWEVAHALGFTDSKFSRVMRLELPPDEQQRIVDVIDSIRRERDEEET